MEDDNFVEIDDYCANNDIDDFDLHGENPIEDEPTEEDKRDILYE